MTVIKISDIINDINDIETYVEAVSSEKKTISHASQYYSSNLCSDVVKRFLETKDRRFKTMNYLMKGNLPICDKFFSARNENILYIFNEYKTFYSVDFYISHDGILKFVNDTDKEFYTNGKMIIIENRCDEQSNKIDTNSIILTDKVEHKIILTEQKMQTGITESVKLNITELALVNY